MAAPAARAKELRQTAKIGNRPFILYPPFQEWPSRGWVSIFYSTLFQFCAAFLRRRTFLAAHALLPRNKVLGLRAKFAWPKPGAMQRKEPATSRLAQA